MNKILNLKISAVLLGLTFVTVFSLPPENVSAQKKSKTTAGVKSKSLCQTNEQTIWSCATTKNKVASVCASKELTEDKGFVQYRFGVLGKVEFEFPKDRAGSQKAFKYSRYTRPLVTMLTLSFENSGVVYEIHDDDNSEEKPPIRAASIDIKDGAKESSVECKQPSLGSLMKLEDLVPRDEEN